MEVFIITVSLLAFSVIIAFAWHLHERLKQVEKEIFNEK